MTNPYNARLSSARQRVAMGAITDRTGVSLAYTNDKGERVYASDKYARRALSQTVGDPLSMSGTSVEAFHAGTLLGFSGSIIDRGWQLFRGSGPKGDNIRLSIDAELTTYISRQFPDGYDGAVVVINYRTGEILAMVSKPDYDPARLDNRQIDSEGSAYLNRCLQGMYTPGSIFKIVTMNAALSSVPGVKNRTFHCDGEYYYGEVPIRCQGGTKHGDLTLQQAFEKSCNVTFGALAYEMGAGNLIANAQAMGFNTNFRYQDIILYNSDIPTDIGSSAELAWTGVGQGRVLVTPLHMAMIAGSVANRGQMMEPRLIEEVTGSTGLHRLRAPRANPRTAMSESIAGTIKEGMRFAVEKGTAKNAAIKNVAVCGKTGSAEVSDNKSVKTHAWFVGFVDDPANPYAIAVIVEHGGAGSDRPSKLAAKVLKKAIDVVR